MNLTNIIENQRKNGRFFTVWFTKKDGTARRMTCRFGVKKHLSGGKATVNEDKFFIVWDCGKQSYRAVNKETVQTVKANGQEYVLG